jgi:3-deoxy-7-phosphoheptulonate synthase
MPVYDDAAALGAAEDELRAQKPLVDAAAVDALRASLARVAEGNGFILQGGDCAEAFSDAQPHPVHDTCRLLLKLGGIVSAAAGIEPVLIGRMAGQFAKPRSAPLESKDGQILPCYKGDIVNDAAFTAEARRHDPRRMLQAYAQSARTLVEIEGFGEALRAMTAGAQGKSPLYVSHEALLLHYEEPLTRPATDNDGGFYDLSAHFLWIGERTRQPGGAHAEFISGIRNPVAVKCGPAGDTDDILRLLDKIDPAHAPGRVTLITRMGHDKIEGSLPALIRAVTGTGRKVVWCCDPMHGNTQTASNGYKTRRFADIERETRHFFAIHGAEGTHAGGLHCEMTGEDVTECTGGLFNVSEDSLPDNYRTYCDPRLNSLQAMELIFTVAVELGAHIKKKA